MFLLPLATNLEAITTCELCKEKLHLNIDNFDIQELYRTHVQVSKASAAENKGGKRGCFSYCSLTLEGDKHNSRPRSQSMMNSLAVDSIWWCCYISVSRGSQMCWELSMELG